MNSINWPAPNIILLWIIIAQLVEHCSANAKAMGLNPVEARKKYLGLTLRLLKSQSQMRLSHLHFKKYCCVHQLCLTLADLAVQMPQWKEVVSELSQRYLHSVHEQKCGLYIINLSINRACGIICRCEIA